MFAARGAVQGCFCVVFDTPVYAWESAKSFQNDIFPKGSWCAWCMWSRMTSSEMLSDCIEFSPISGFSRTLQLSQDLRGGNLGRYGFAHLTMMVEENSKFFHLGFVSVFFSLVNDKPLTNGMSVVDQCYFTKHVDLAWSKDQTFRWTSMGFTINWTTMDLGRSEEQFLDWRKGNLTEDSLLFFKPLWQEFPHLDRFPPANAKITGESEATYQESHQMQVDEGSTCSQRQCSLSMMFHGLSLGPETLIQWKASAVARSEENEKWKQNWTKQMRAGALWGPVGPWDLISQDAPSCFWWSCQYFSHSGRSNWTFNITQLS